MIPLSTVAPAAVATPTVTPLDAQVVSTATTTVSTAAPAAVATPTAIPLDAQVAWAWPGGGARDGTIGMTRVVYHAQTVSDGLVTVAMILPSVRYGCAQCQSA